MHIHLKHLFGSTFIGLTLLMTSCSKNDNKGDETTTTPVKINYAFANVAGAYPNQTTYLKGLPDLNITSLNNKNATEAANFSSMWSYNGSVYLTYFGAPATIVKYNFDEKGNAVMAGKLVVPGANTFSSVEFVTPTEAYASLGGGLARAIKFDPSLFQITGEINLAGIQRAAAKSVFYQGMKARDGKLFMGVHYTNAAQDPLYDSAFVAVIDLASGKVEKLLSDARTSTIFIAGSSVNAFSLDNKGDLYIQGTGSAKAPSGILRIPKGTTGFDPAYFFDLKAATGNNCYGFYHFDSGLGFVCRISDPSDAYEFNGPNYEYFRIDLEKKTSLGKLGTLPKVFGSTTSIMRQFTNDEILFVVATATENAVYSYKTADGSISKKIALDAGQCTGFNKIN